MAYDPYSEEPGEPDDACDLGFLNDGRPTLMTLANAVQCWSLCQKRKDITVGEAAEAFNTPAERVAEAVETHPWLLLLRADDEPFEAAFIEHDGI